MPRHEETRALPYSAEQMFELVADVASYPQFLPWVSAVRIRTDSETEMLADMIVGFKSLKETFTSRVAKTRPGHIHVDYIDGPLKHLSNDWRFEDDGKGGVVLYFAVDFAFKNRMFEMLAGQVFDRALRKMTNAFETRAAVLYGVGGSGNSSSSAHSVA